MIKLSIVERQILWNQLDIMERLETNPHTLKSLSRRKTILQDGYASNYSQVMHVGREPELLSEDAKFVCQVFEMMDGLQRYRDERGGTIRFHYDRFLGYDGNNETELLGYARFLVEENEQWEHLNITNFNSHAQVCPAYRRMLAVWTTFPMPDRITALKDEQVAAMRDAASKR